MVQIMQRLLEGVQGELQSEERDLCAHLNAHAHLLTLEAHLNCLEGSGSGLDSLPSSDSKGKSKGKQAVTPEGSPEGSDSAARSKRRLSPGQPLPLKCMPLPFYMLVLLWHLSMHATASVTACFLFCWLCNFPSVPGLLLLAI